MSEALALSSNSSTTVRVFAARGETRAAQRSAFAMACRRRSRGYCARTDLGIGAGVDNASTRSRPPAPHIRRPPTHRDLRGRRRTAGVDPRADLGQIEAGDLACRRAQPHAGQASYLHPVGCFARDLEVRTKTGAVDKLGCCCEVCHVAYRCGARQIDCRAVVGQFPPRDGLISLSQRGTQRRCGQPPEGGS
jgi:hypothetical protein